MSGGWAWVGRCSALVGVRLAGIVSMCLLGACAASVPTISSGDAAVSSTVVDASSTVDPAVATSTADRLRGPQPVTACQQIAFDIGVRRGTATQVVVVTTTSTSSSSATLQVATLSERGWTCGPEMSARVGRNGVRPLLERRSGDGTTPAGVFPLGVMTAWDGKVFRMFGNSADPGVSAGPYRRVRVGDCFGATPNHPDYGHLVYRSAAECPGPDDEYLPKYTNTYEHAALIGANMEPDVSGDAPGEIPYAAAIFLHRHSYDGTGATKPTSGCVSLRHDDLVAVLRALRPDVVFAIGTEEWLLSGAW